jgi:hypothetical protein
MPLGTLDPLEAKGLVICADLAIGVSQ